MEELTQILNAYLQRLPANAPFHSLQELENLQYIYPFNKFEHIFVKLIADGLLTTDEYEKIKADYEKRNKYLPLFELAPRTFGEVWGEKHLRTINPQLIKASKALDPKFDGEYDLIYNGLKIESKASRAVLQKAGATMTQKALKHGTDKDFIMNFQQLKPECCDAFIWMAVWRDKIDYWILTSDEVKNNPGFSNQHRKQADGKDIYEGQIFMTRKNYKDFEKYRVEPDKIIQRLDEIKNLIKPAN